MPGLAAPPTAVNARALAGGVPARLGGAGLIAARLVAASLAAACLIAAGGCDSGGGGKSLTVDGQRMRVRGELAVAGGPVKATVRDDYFAPNVIRAPRGSTVTLDLNNDGRALHNVSVTDQEVDSDIQPAGSRSVDITVPPSGQVVFFCKYYRKTAAMLGVVRST